MKKLSFSVSLAVLCCCVCACSANPGPPPVENPETTTTSAPPENDKKKTKRATIGIGIDRIMRGVNPHLVADDQAFVQALASLVLPSCFVQGELNADVLTSAEEINPAAENVAQTVRYEIHREAQWSDGAPITGADFRYLWEGMVSTPGVINPEPYRAISQIRVSNGGKTVEVDFARRIDHWQVLFNNLLPSHMFNTGVAFEQALSDSIPASAGRYMVQSIDRQRGAITLNRNDRFWGAQPAQTELLEFRELRNPTHAAEMLRSGQISVAELTPTETSLESLDLLPHTQVRTRDRASYLELSLSVESALLSDPQLRHALAQLIDVPRVARLAAGRSSDLAAAEAVTHGTEQDRAAALDAVKAGVVEHGPLRLAADANDSTATAAVITIADVLRAEGIEVETTLDDMNTIAGTQLPAGEVDAVISWARAGTGVEVVAGRYTCPQPATTVTTAGTAITEEGTPIFSGNLSGLCIPEVAEVAAAALAGEVPEEEYLRFFAEVEDRERVRIPILTDRRLEVLGKGVTGPSDQLADWPVGEQAGVLISAPQWKNTGNSAMEVE